LAKPARLLDLPEHRFHQAFARRVDGFAHFGLQLPYHPLHIRRVLRQQTTLRRQAMLAMLCLPVAMNPTIFRSGSAPNNIRCPPRSLPDTAPIVVRSVPPWASVAVYHLSHDTALNTDVDIRGGQKSSGRKIRCEQWREPLILVVTAKVAE
jgi:hypothetical protein